MHLGATDLDPGVGGGGVMLVEVQLLGAITVESWRWFWVIDCCYGGQVILTPRVMEGGTWAWSLLCCSEWEGSQSVVKTLRALLSQSHFGEREKACRNISESMKTDCFNVHCCWGEIFAFTLLERDSGSGFWFLAWDWCVLQNVKCVKVMFVWSVFKELFNFF